MTAKDFIISSYTATSDSGKVAWSAPSNIALVKYWGKHSGQIPANPSVSFTLQSSKTNTSIEFQKKKTPNEEFSFDFYFEGKSKPDFRPKILTFFERIVEFLPFLTKYHFIISSENTFPHSSGIASSASSMASLSICLMQIEKLLYPQMEDDFFNRKASFLARLGSGSACRSTGGNIVVWGKNNIVEGSSDLYGIPYPYRVNEIFKNYQDTILLIDKGQKKVSSSTGHNLMNNHPFAQQRFAQAHTNLEKLKSIFESGNLEEFMQVVESEALTLHAMMMTSIPYFILMKSNTLAVIEKIWAFRERTQIPVCFTLDAGANVHVLYPEKYKKEGLQFIQEELVDYCENKQYLCDQLTDL